VDSKPATKVCAVWQRHWVPLREHIRCGNRAASNPCGAVVGHPLEVLLSADRTLLIVVIVLVPGRITSADTRAIASIGLLCRAATQKMLRLRFQGLARRGGPHRPLLSIKRGGRCGPLTSSGSNAVQNEAGLHNPRHTLHQQTVQKSDPWQHT